MLAVYKAMCYAYAIALKSPIHSKPALYIIKNMQRIAFKLTHSSVE